MSPLSAGQPSPGEVVWSTRPRSVLLAPSPAPRHSRPTRRSTWPSGSSTWRPPSRTSATRSPSWRA